MAVRPLIVSGVQWALVGVGAALVSSWLLHGRTPEVSEQVHTAPAAETAVFLGVRMLELPSFVIPRGYLWGAGKFAVFELSVPFGEELRMEELVVVREGGTDEEVPEAWLRLRGERVYTVAAFKDGVATFRAFPPADAGVRETLPQHSVRNDAEEQIVLEADALPAILTSDASTKVEIYGVFGDSLTSRAPEEGIRFCLKEIRGTFLTSKKTAVTSLTPTCWPRMGIE